MTNDERPLHVVAEEEYDDFVCPGCIAEMIILDELVFAGIDPELAEALAHNLTGMLIDADII